MFYFTKDFFMLFRVAVVTLLLVALVNAQFELACKPTEYSKDALFITPDCVDELYSHPIIDSQTNQTDPVPHLHISGHFDNTSISFNFYFPPKANWGGRFFQFVYPTQSANASAEHIAFGADSQAYTIQITGANGYRHEAAGAKFSRVVAQRYYQAERHIYGYVYGGSGGSYQTVGALENTDGVWDGGVPMIQGVPVSAPNGPSARAFFGHILRPRMSQIQDALMPGGSGDPYLALNSFEQDMLHQATMFGIPTRAWEDFQLAGNRLGLSIQEPFINSVDASYNNDFWTKPGYLGTDPGELGDVLRASLVEFNATIRAIQRGPDDVPLAFEVNYAANNSRAQYDEWSFSLAVSSANGTELGMLRGLFSQTTRVVKLQGIGIVNDVNLLNSLTEGVNVSVSNRMFVAVHAFHRHQVPSRKGFIGFDQYRSNNGSVIYPQRPIDASRILSEAVCGGCTYSGRINAKTIVIQNLMDSDAFPWHGDWYRSQIKRSLGNDKYAESYRIYFNDHADHNYGEPALSRAGFIVNFNGIYQQALRDLSAWVEKGILPPPSTNYNLTSENLVRVPATAVERAGIQPVAHLKVAGCNSTRGSSSTGDAATYVTYSARVGEELVFDAWVEAPSGTGRIVDLEWDFLGNAQFISLFGVEPRESMVIQRPFSYHEPGNYTVALRVTSQREGSVNTAFGRVRNLARMHVEVQ